MAHPCAFSSSGGKGNRGMFTERDAKVIAAGIKSAQEQESVAKSLQQYSLQDEVDALIHDAIIPPQKSKKLPPLRKPIQKDMRFAFYTEVGDIINPPMKTKFVSLVGDLKETVYSSFWKKDLGKVSDQIPYLPAGTNIYETTFGRKNPSRSYDIIIPKIPSLDQTPKSKVAGLQIERNYCKPAFNSNLVFGKKTCCDPSGALVKSCLTDENIIQGTGCYKPMTTIKADKMELKNRDLSKDLPAGLVSGNTDPFKNPEWLCCEPNPKLIKYRKCFKNLNSLRVALSKRCDPLFYKHLYSQLKYLDTAKTGWIQKEIIYRFCNTIFLRVDPDLTEPILACLNAFDGHQIEYKSFVNLINFREPLPEFPKVWYVPEDCLEYRTTYTDMVKPGQEKDERRRAGIPTGRYFDRDYPVTPENECKAVNSYLPDETDARACLKPSLLTLLGVTHRDMFCQRDHDVVKKVFEAAGESFTDESFKEVWEEAKKYHSEGLVCFETFRRALNKLKA